ncbi:MAG: glutamate--tRNA ligase, partial [Desulfofustis sp.]|nr:glutamate--tRNA ligase [Desulfofustis sp.]
AELIATELWDDAYDTDRRSWFLSTIELIRSRFHTLKDFSSVGRAYFSDDYLVDDKAFRKNLATTPDLQLWLVELARQYQTLPDFSLTETERLARETAERVDVKPGIIINAMRTVLTGQLAGPSMFDILLALGRETVVKRLSATPDIYRLFQPQQP